MAPRRIRKISNQAEGHTDGQISKEMRQKQKALFIQQFEKEAQDRINEMEAKLEQTLATVDRVFKVELMKMPPALQKTLIIDLINEDDISAGEVTIAIKTESPEIHQPLTRKLSKKVKVSEGASAHKRKTTTEPSKGSKKARSLANSSSTGSLRCATSTNTKRTKTRLAKISDQSPLTGTKHRSVLRSASDDHLYCSLSGLSPHVTISTAHGETLCLSDDTVEDVDIGLLDDMAVLQMQKLMKLMDYLFNKVKANQQ
ncbi:borealin-2-like isoform X1 [Coregonus clupeaformis]|uniref:borealin-2-like isoform X1 n=1 Tax=Coregonus clupeaformis TaxID=59861 RepID=UPI001E1C40EB|nr:borealin-2-like isoform X1 [Coregonus clupeaformis]